MPISGLNPTRPFSTSSGGGGSSSSPAPASAGTGTSSTTPTVDQYEQGLTTSQKKSAERALSRAGLFNGGKVDGSLTANSRKAIQRFQSAHGLAETGTLDRTTYRKLIDLSKLIAKRGTAIVRPGMASSRIKTIEQRLQRLGYDVGSADGLYSTQTAQAVRAFKKDQKIKDTTGVIGPAGQKHLRSEFNAITHAPYRNRVKNTAAHRAAEANTTTQSKKIHADGTEGMRRGPGKKASVKHVQRHLLAAGFDPKRTDGVFDDRTEGMVKQFQRKSGLPVHGRVDRATWQKLRTARIESSNVPMSVGEKSSAVKSAETLLKRLGFNPGKVDGLYDKNTQRAVDRFRRAHGRNGIGKGITKATLAAIKKEARSGVTTTQLRQIMPGLSLGRARQLINPLNDAMREAGITTKKRQAAFLAQLGHESVGLRYFEEIASGAAYEGRLDLGNTQPGDGKRFKGRGPIQLTGRANYRAAGKALGLPLESNPQMAAKPSVGFRVAAWFWTTRGLNSLADAGKFDEITRRINGGTNGLQDRRDYWARAKRVL